MPRGGDWGGGGERDLKRKIIHRPLKPKILGTLRSDDGDGNGNAAKTIGLISKTTI